MRLAIMQPYFFPYIGYFQLMSAVDRFVLLDDVSYINRGWINRNRILVNGEPHLFTIPLSNASQNVLIRDLEVTQDEKWQRKFLRTIECAYRKAPFYSEVSALLDEVLTTEFRQFREWLRRGLLSVRDHLGLTTEVVQTSEYYGNQKLKGQERIINICRQEGATHYVNPPGGRELYAAKDFAVEGLELSFLRSEEVAYQQIGPAFIPWLSIVDVMMFNSPAEVCHMLERYSLEKHRVPMRQTVCS